MSLADDPGKVPEQNVYIGFEEMASLDATVFPDGMCTSKPNLSFFRAMLVQLFNIPPIRNYLINKSSEELPSSSDTTTIASVSHLLKHMDLFTQIRTAKILFMLALEKYHPESPFTQLPKPILKIIIQYCNGAQHRALISYSYLFHSPELPVPSDSELWSGTLETLNLQCKALFDSMRFKIANQLLPSCNHLVARSEDTLCPNLPVSQNIMKSLQSFFDEDSLGNYNKYLCETCRGRYETIRRTRMEFPPSYLCLVLQRQAFDFETLTAVWVHDLMPIEKDLDIASIVYPEPNSPVLYELHGVVLSHKNWESCIPVFKNFENRWMFYDEYKGEVELAYVKNMEEELKLIGTSKSLFGTRCVAGVVYKRASQ